MFWWEDTAANIFRLVSTVFSSMMGYRSVLLLFFLYSIYFSLPVFFPLFAGAMEETASIMIPYKDTGASNCSSIKGVVMVEIVEERTGKSMKSFYPIYEYNDSWGYIQLSIKDLLALEHGGDTVFKISIQDYGDFPVGTRDFPVKIPVPLDSSIVRPVKCNVESEGLVSSVWRTLSRFFDNVSWLIILASLPIIVIMGYRMPNLVTGDIKVLINLGSSRLRLLYAVLIVSLIISLSAYMVGVSIGFTLFSLSLWLSSGVFHIYTAVPSPWEMLSTYKIFLLNTVVFTVSFAAGYWRLSGWKY